MALLSNHSYIIPTVMIDLIFEDNVRKCFPVACKDIIRVTYNLNGIATTIQGRVVSINAATTNYSYKANGVCNCDTTYATNKNGPYIVIDGSDTYEGKTATVYLGTILDCDMIYKWSDNYVVTTPPKDTESKIESVQMIRINDGKLEVTTDFGATWFTPDVTEVSSDTSDAGN